MTARMAAPASDLILFLLKLPPAMEYAELYRIPPDSRSRRGVLANLEGDSIDPVEAPGILGPRLEDAGPRAEGADVDVEAVGNAPAEERQPHGASARGGDAGPRAEDVLVLVSVRVGGLASGESVGRVLGSWIRGPRRSESNLGSLIDPDRLRDRRGGSAAAVTHFDPRGLRARSGDDAVHDQIEAGAAAAPGDVEIVPVR